MGEQVPHLYRPRQEMAKGCLKQGLVPSCQ